MVLTSLANYPDPVARDFHDPKCKVDLHSSTPRGDSCRKKFSPRLLLVKSLSDRTNFYWFNGLLTLLFFFFMNLLLKLIIQRSHYLPISFGLETLFQSPWPRAPYLPSPVVITRPVLLTKTLKLCPAPTLLKLNTI